MYRYKSNIWYKYKSYTRDDNLDFYIYIYKSVSNIAFIYVWLNKALDIKKKKIFKCLFLNGVRQVSIVKI